MENVHILDGNNFFSRVWFVQGFPDLESVINAFLKFRQKNKGRTLVAFDTTKSKRRLEIHPEYKAGRKSSMTEEEYAFFKRNLNAFIDLLKNSGIDVLEGDGYEADDYIAMATNLLKRYHVFIHSTDKDFLQLVSKRVTFAMPTKEELVYVTPENFTEIVGVDLIYAADYKSIIGDKSDNIKGIEGIGEKTAQKYINAYGTYEQICKYLENKAQEPKKKDQPTKTEMKFLNGKEGFEMAKQLIDLSLVNDDKELKNLVSKKVRQRKIDKKGIVKALSEVDSQSAYSTVVMLCRMK